MKTSQDPRHQKRRQIVQNLFSLSFNAQETDDETKKVWEKTSEIDPIIQKAAPEWPIKNINPVELAILRLATYEMVIDKSEPEKVIIDEAIELAKEFGSETSPAFINGALGAVSTIQNEPK